MSKLPSTGASLLRHLRQQKRLALRQAQSSAFTRSGISVDAEGAASVAGSLTVTGPAVFITPLPTAPYGSDPAAPTGTSTPAGTLGAATVRAQGDSTAVGSNAQQYLTTGSAATAVGSDAQAALTTGYNDTAVGASAQQSLTAGMHDTAVGTLAQRDLTTGDQNTAVGSYAQIYLTTGYGDTAIGATSQAALTTGYNDTAVGPDAQYSLTTGHDDTAVGARAQRSPLGNTANKTTTASYQTSIGPETGQSSATQVDGITTIGYQATAGAANATSIGREARADHAGSIAIGYQTLTTQVDQVMVGPRDVEITDTTKGLVLVSPDGTRYRVTVANGGALAGGGGSPPAATDTAAGVVELATTAEAVTGTDTVRAVTPAGVAAAVNAVGTSTGVAYSAGWADYGSGFSPATWYKDKDGFIRLSGLLLRTGATITAGASGTIFTLPVGARPAGNETFVLLGPSGSAVGFQVTSTGVCQVASANTWTSGGSYMYVSGVMFKAA